MFSAALMLLLAAGSCVYSIDLIQPDSVVVQPGQTLTVTCQVSGYSLTDSSYATGWIRQCEGKPMDWIFYQWGGGEFYQNNDLKNKFSYSRDTSAGTVTIKGQNLQPEDTAVYYCVRVWSEIKLDQSPSEVKRPGETVKMSCIISGYSMTSYNIHWIRQRPGKALEWIGWINTDTNTPSYVSSFQSRFSFTQDVSSSTQYLEVKSLTAEDSAFYFGARRSTVTEYSEAAAQNPPQTI
ncbi:hypothetical protein PAMA_009349 [Pampus argenteus]